MPAASTPLLFPHGHWHGSWCRSEVIARVAAAGRPAVTVVAPAVGLLLLDVAVQCAQVTNQARIFALRPEARSRLNTGYMTCAFLGGSAGSWLGTRAYVQLGRGAVCALIALAALLALTAYLSGISPYSSRMSNS
ncbi:hypothetical protein [Streptomyces griseus]|uniref:hypothetical protein n=1 Tax=Streptomyces griseus TaxID=1911 RepID=UPI00055B4FA0